MAYNDPTTNYLWDLPTEGGDTNDWGRLLNEIFGNATTGIDAVVKAVSDKADDAMPKLGGEFTGDVTLGANARIVETAKSDGLSVDWANGNFFHVTLSSGSNSVTFSGYPSSGDVQFITLETKQPAGGDGTISWPASVKWSEGVAPTLSTDGAGIDVFVFYTRDGGANVYGAHSIQEPS
jgi:hypothetical protein